jgi:glycosyltransferase involved in cell wall biosynthesis
VRIGVFFQTDLTAQGELSLGGVPTILRSLFPVAASHHAVTHYGAWAPGAPREPREIPLGECSSYRFIPLCELKRPVLPRYALGLMRESRKGQQLDCLFSHRIEYAPILTNWPDNPPLVTMLHDTGARTWSRAPSVYDRLERLAFDRSALIVATKIKDCGLEYYQAKYPQHAHKLVYNRVPVRDAFFEPRDGAALRARYGLPQDAFMVGYLGRLVRQSKRAHLLAPLFERLAAADPRIHLILVGDGDELPELNRAFAKAGLTPRVHVFPNATQDQVPGLVACFDCGITLSDSEATCLSNLEILASGHPVVSTDPGDIPTYLVPNLHGALLAAGLPESAIVAEAYVEVLALAASVQSGWSEHCRKAADPYRAHKTLNSLLTHLIVAR